MMMSSNGNIFRVTGHLCGEFTGPGEFPTQRPVTRSFDVFFDICLYKRLSKQSRGWWFETQSRPLWRQCNDDIQYLWTRWRHLKWSDWSRKNSMWRLFFILLTVGSYSEGNLLVVYEMRRHFLPTSRSPTTTHFTVCILTRLHLELKKTRITGANDYHYNDVINCFLKHQPHGCLLKRLFWQIKENIKVPRHWPLWGEFTGDRWIPRTKGQ